MEQTHNIWSRIKRHPRRSVLIAVSAVIISLVGYGAWSLSQLRSDLQTADTAIQQLRSAAKAGNVGALQASATQLDSALADAHGQLAAPPWRLAGMLPFVGDDVNGARAAVDAGYGLTQRSLPAAESIVRILPSLRPQKGKVDLTAVAELKEPVHQIAEALADAQQTLNEQDPSGFVDQLSTRYRGLQSQVNAAAESMSTASSVVDQLPDALGASGERRYLLVFASNAESRAGGGFPGAMAMLSADAGRITMGDQASLGDFAVAGKDGRTTPILPLTAEEEYFFGSQLGAYMGDANLTPDFVRAAQLLRAWWKEKRADVDGVVQLDPIALSYLMPAIGSITVDGHELTEKNIAGYLQNQVYIDYDPAGQDAFFAKTAREVFSQLLGTDAWPAKGAALTKAAEEGRLKMQFDDAALQRAVATAGISGELPTPSQFPDVGVYVNDATGTKLSYYLDYNVDIAAVSCDASSQQLEAKAVIKSNLTSAQASRLPAYLKGGAGLGIAPGNQIDAILIVGPAEGTVSDLAINGTKQVDAEVSTFAGRPAVETFVELKPGQSWTITWKMTTGEGQTGDIHTQVTPSAKPGTKSRTFTTACR